MSVWLLRAMSFSSSSSFFWLCWFSFRARLWSRRSPSRTCSDRSSATIASPFFTGVPARFRMRRTRASAGLDRTFSTSGSTVPAALIVASIGPSSTTAMRIALRRSEGRSSEGPQTKATDTPATAKPATVARFRFRWRVTSASIGRSTLPPRRS